VSDPISGGTDFRVERDSLGEVQVPADALWGAQTERARRSFRASGLRCDPALITAYARVKRAAALANGEVGGLDRAKAGAIAAAAVEVIAGRHAGQFPLDPFQAGAGTSLNMNLNEVLANRALELLGRTRGESAFLSPNDDVNRSQSTNDTYPTALHLAVLRRWGDLVPVLLALAEAFEERGEAFHGVVKAGRTHLQDAVPVRLGREMKAYGAALRRTVRLGVAASRELCSLPLGGSAAGTGLNVPAGFRERVVHELAKETRMPLRSAKDLYEAMQSRQAIGAMSGVLRSLALELIRIANDLRLLASGPATGLAEISLPAVQPGSSIMPGKVNPVMAECLDMVSFQVVGNDAAVAMAVQAGQLELNVMMPLMAHALLGSFGLLVTYLPDFAEKCVKGIETDEARCAGYAGSSAALATVLNPVIGYLPAAALVKESIATGVPAVELAVRKGLLSRQDADRLFSPERMTGEE
jgi:aspartate ammonia-lyase